MSDAPAMTSNRPYLLRALYEWIADNGMTPYLLVDAAVEGVQVPAAAIKEGRVVPLPSWISATARCASWPVSAASCRKKARTIRPRRRATVPSAAATCAS